MRPPKHYQRVRDECNMEQPVPNTNLWMMYIRLLTCPGVKLLIMQTSLRNAFDHNARVSTPPATVQFSTVQFNTVQYSTVQYSVVQCSAAQYNTIQCSTCAGFYCKAYHIVLYCSVWCWYTPLLVSRYVVIMTISMCTLCCMWTHSCWSPLTACSLHNLNPLAAGQPVDGPGGAVEEGTVAEVLVLVSGPLAE